jgi:hypothetical protein
MVVELLAAGTVTEGWLLPLVPSIEERARPERIGSREFLPKASSERRPFWGRPLAMNRAGEPCTATRPSIQVPHGQP